MKLTRRQNREFELKVEVPEAEGLWLESASVTRKLASGAPLRKELRTIYFDTPRYKLRKTGITLRLREDEGIWLQTVKAERNLSGGISNPIEVETFSEGPKPDLKKIHDGKLRRTIRKLAVRSQLRPIFETVMQRTAIPLTTKNAEIELAIDQGRISANGQDTELHEVELELKSGQTEGLLKAALELFGNLDYSLSKYTKADRGYQLIGAQQATMDQNDGPKNRPLKRRDTCAKAFSAILYSATRQILINWRRVLETDDPEGVHQMHIGLRRLRSALKALRPIVASPSLREFELFAREIGRSVGRLRDADVLVGSVVTSPMSYTSSKRGFAELHSSLLQHRQLEREAARAILVGPEWKHLRLYLAIWPHILMESRAARLPIVDYAPKALEKAWRRLAKHGKNIAALKPPERHEMRKKLKDLRYLSEFFRPLFARPRARQFIKHMKTLQSNFGYVNDVRMAAQIPEIQQRMHTSIEAQGAAGYVVGWHEAEVRHDWNKAKKIGASWK